MGTLGGMRQPDWTSEDGAVRLHCCDCRDLEIVPEAGDSLVTDPPWGINYKSGHNSSRTGNGAALVRKDGNFAPIIGDDVPFDPAALPAFARIVLWGGHRFYDKLPPGGTWLVWDKLAGKTSFPSSSDCEMAWCNWSGPCRIFTHLWRGIMRAGEENIVHSPKLHPHQKPVALMAWSIEAAGGSRIVDPYMGSGTTGVAAVRAGLGFVWVEKSPDYFEIAKERIRKAVEERLPFPVAAGG
jgi:site-specific DNA-methyltransferase (adenine-specific)